MLVDTIQGPYFACIREFQTPRIEESCCMPRNEGLPPHCQGLDPKPSIPNKLANHVPCKKINTPSTLVGALDEVPEELLEIKKASLWNNCIRKQINKHKTENRSH